MSAQTAHCFGSSASEQLSQVIYSAAIRSLGILPMVFSRLD